MYINCWQNNIFLEIEKRSEKSQKRKTSHESHPISKRNKISITNTSATGNIVLVI